MVSPRLVAQGVERRGQIHGFVVGYREAFGISPSIAEIALALEVQPSAVRRHVGILIAEGTLVQSPGKSRTLRPARRSRKVS